MRKFVCTVCGYVYDEAKEKLRWDELPEDWRCPLCGAAKSDFKEISEEAPGIPEKKASAVQAPEMKQLNAGELSALCSNLAKGCEKQYLAEQAALFGELADYYKSHTPQVPEKDFEAILEKINSDLEAGFPAANAAAADASDRGAKRALTWSEKVTRILSSLLARYEKEGDAMLENTNVFVCDICGFIYIGDEAPAVCPICKVPNLKIIKLERR
ncbi:MAG: rubredoxin [Clostridiales bacterium]|nr:rubredoxin [Clostridiales bacterium]